MSTAAERSQLRKSLLQLSSLLLLALLSLALLAQFAVWSLQRAHVRSDQDAAHLVAALDASRQVQVVSFLVHRPASSKDFQPLDRRSL